MACDCVYVVHVADFCDGDVTEPELLVGELILSSDDLYVDDDVLLEVLCVGQKAEGSVEVCLCTDLVGLEGEGIDNVDALVDMGHQNHGRKAPPTQLLREQQKVILAQGNNLNRDRLLVVEHIAVVVLRDQSLALFHLNRAITRDEVHQFNSKILVLEVKVEPLALLFDVRAILMHVVVKDKLLNEQKSLLVVHILTQLNLSAPSTVRVLLFTIIALKIHNTETYFNTLLKSDTTENLLRHIQFNNKTLAVRLSPNKLSITQTQLTQAMNTLQAKLKKLLTLMFSANPNIWRTQKATTFTAKVNNFFFVQFQTQVKLILNTIHAHVTRVGRNGTTTRTT